jgi:hypothetical protein
MTGADRGTGPGARPEWRWDVALSFAGAQRDYVLQVAEALKAQGVRCFYDADEQIELWGKYLAEELPAIYGEQAATVVVFVSAEYAARDWTRLERRAALNRAVRERQQYVLPARFDDTPLPGLLSDMVAIDLRDRSPQQFAAMIAAKLADLAIVVSVPPTDAEPSAPTLHQATASAARPPTRSLSVFEVAIGPGGAPGMFRVEVVTSPAGEASATVELDAEALLARRGLLQQAVLASAVASRRVLPETEQPLREVGNALFAGLLGTGEVAGRYRAATAVAAEHGEGLRVVLRIDTPALAGLPWEAMYDQAAGAYVCLQDQLVRRVSVGSVPAPLLVRSPLRILGVVSSPHGLPALDVDKEQDQLTRALARPASQGLAELHWAPSATWADLQDLLLDGEWHVLHFIGHGDFDPGRDEGVLALTREDGRADLVAAHRLTDLLRQARPMPRLVVLNSCSGAAAGASDLFSGTAAALVRGGVSAVAAMQYEISDPAAVAFARGFYAAIARGRGVDDAVSSGRVAILGLSDRTLEWVTPVLYLRGHDTRLFTLPAAGEARNREDIDAEEAPSFDVEAGARLREGARAHGLLSSGAAEDSAEQAPAPAPGEASEPAGPRFGPYILTALLGRGEMSVIYRAYDTARARVVALKVLIPEVSADRGFRERFRREYRRTARLSEPHIIPIHDYGEIDGRLFIDMRLVEGTDLGTMLARDGPLPANEAAWIIAQVASALDAAHADGLVHHDVKPSNVLITGQVRSMPFVYLKNFGIVRPSRSGTLSSTSTIGTPAYVAPEQLEGSPGGQRADVYSLACVLYESLTGRPPFTGEMAAVMWAHLHAPPPAPSAIRPDLPSAVDQVIARGMAKNPASRYGSAGELAAAMLAAV